MEEQKEISPFGEMPESQSSAEEQLQQIVQSSEVVAPVEQVAQGQSQEGAVEYAGFWARFAAMFVDGLVLIIPSAVVQGIFGKPFGTILGWALTWVYAIWMLNEKQATLGKMAVGLKVTSVDGQKTTVRKLAMREILGKLLNVITLGIGYLMVAFTAKKQGLHDMIADTVVVYDPMRKQRGWVVVAGVVAFLVVPIAGIVAGIFLVTTNNARNMASDAKAKAVASSQTPNIATVPPVQNNIDNANSAPISPSNVSVGGNLNPVNSGNVDSVAKLNDNDLFVNVADDISMVSTASVVAKKWQSDAQMYSALMYLSTLNTSQHSVAFKSKNSIGKMYVVTLDNDNKIINAGETEDTILNNSGYIEVNGLKVSSAQAFKIADDLVNNNEKNFSNYDTAFALLYNRSININVWSYMLTNKSNASDFVVILVDATSGKVVQSNLK